MIDPVSVALASAAAIVALAAGWLSVPRSPDLNAERWFKVGLATLCRGQVEAASGGVDEWEQLVIEGIPFHPAAGEVEVRLERPNTAVRSDRVAGEADLLAELVRRESSRERYQYLFHEDVVGREARLSDPVDLGDVYDPARLLGSGCGWDAVADWGAGEGTAVLSALTRVLPARWVTVGVDGSAPAVLAALRDLGAVSMGLDDLTASLSALVPNPADRLVVVAAGDALVAVMAALLASAGLRDRVLAVVSVGGNCQGRPGGVHDEAERRDWNEANFVDARLDLEAHRPFFFLAMQWLDPTEQPVGFSGLPVASARFWQPSRSGVQDRVLRPVDLGVLPADGPVPPLVIAKALMLTTTLLVHNG